MAGSLCVKDVHAQLHPQTIRCQYGKKSFKDHVGPHSMPCDYSTGPQGFGPYGASKLPGSLM